MTVVVRDRMTSPATTLTSQATTREVLELLERRGISAAPIVDEGRLVGIVSTTDLVRELAHPAAEGAVQNAADYMRRPVLTATPDEALEVAARRMVRSRVHRLVVVDGDAVLGVLSVRDVLSEVVRLRSSGLLRDVMTTPVETVEIDSPIEDAVSRLAEANVHGLVVVEGETPVGVFTHAEALASRRLPPTLRSRPVEEVMSYEMICLDLTTPVFRAAGYAVNMNVRRLLVVEHRRLVGILSCLDLVATLGET